MKIFKRIGAILINNLWLKILAVLIAFVVWVVVAQINNPVSTHTYSNVKVTLLGTDVLESEGKFYQVVGNSDVIKITVRAPESVISSISPSDIYAVADLSEIREDGTVPIVYSLDRAESIVADHDELQVIVEDKKTRYVNILYEMTGSVGEGCVAGKVTLQRNRIEISGPASDVDKVAYAQVSIDLDGAIKSISADMEIHLFDSTGHRVISDRIVKQTDYVTTTVTVLSTKIVPVYASVTGDTATGYLYSGNISVDPEVVTIAGDTSVLNTINRIEITDPVDIAAATKDVTATFELEKYLPAGVSLEQSGFEGEASVTAYIEKVAEKNINLSPERIAIIGIPDGFTAEILEEGTVSVKLSGLSTELNAISAESLVGSAEITPNSDGVFADGDILILPVKFILTDHVKSDMVYVRVLLTADV